MIKILFILFNKTIKEWIENSQKSISNNKPLPTHNDWLDEITFQGICSSSFFFWVIFIWIACPSSCTDTPYLE